MVNTEDVINRIRAKQDEREANKAQCSPPPVGAREELTTEDLVRRCRDRDNFGTSAAASDILQKIRDRQKTDTWKEKRTVKVIKERADTGEEFVIKDWDANTISLVATDEDKADDAFEYAMAMLEKK